MALRQDIRFLVLDVDGVMTDGGMYYSESGEEIKRFDTKDGRGIIELQKAGVPVGIISSGFKKEIIAGRCKTLGIEHYHIGMEQKLDILRDWCQQMQLELSQVAYIGDDVNDREIIKATGLTGCPADAMQSIKDIVDVVLTRNGGHGCIREFIEEHLGLVL